MSTQEPIHEAARHTCLVCEREYRLTEENHDGWGPVCPHCGAL